MKKTYFILALALTLPVMAFAGDFHFVRKGKAVCQIVIPAKASKFEKMAAEDLSSFLKQMSGAAVRISTENKKNASPAVYIGQTRKAAALGVKFDRLGEEEYQIIPSGKDIVVTGGRPVGSFYGTWKILNRLGVWSLSMEQDIVPQKKDVSLSVKPEKKSPSFASRTIYDHQSIHWRVVGLPEKWWNRYGLYLLRNGINGRQHHVYSPPYVGKMSDIPHSPMQHSYSLYLNPKLYDTHPEYFSMSKDGKREKPESFLARGGVCMSNPAVPEHMYQSLRAMILEHRKKRKKEDWPVLYDMTPLDLPRECFCAPCRKIREEEGGEFGLILRGTNYVAEKIAKEFPEIMIRTFNYGKASGQVKTSAAPNVMVLVCGSFVNGDCFKPVSHKFNKKVQKDLYDSFARRGTKMAIWDYWNMSMYAANPPRMEVLFDCIAPDLRYFKKSNTIYMWIEAEKHVYKPQQFLDLEFFVASQLMMDVDQDPEKLAKIFLEGYYGAAAKDLEKYFNKLREGVKKYPHRQGGMSAKLWDYMTPKFVYDTFIMMENAAKKVPAGSLYERRIQDETLSILWLLIQERGKYLKYFTDRGISHKKIIELCTKRSHTHMKRYDSPKLDSDDTYSKTRRTLEQELNKYANKPLPVPPKFADVDPANRRVFGHYHFNPLPGYHSNRVDDPESPTGKALKVTALDQRKHGEKVIIRDPKGRWAFHATQFGSCDKEIVIQRVPKDEKYHWYVIPNCTVKHNDSWFWGYCWYLQIDLKTAYQIDDGASKENVWDTYFSAKFTGPAYVKGSKKENAIYVDQVVLVRPGETKVRKR